MRTFAVTPKNANKKSLYPYIGQRLEISAVPPKLRIMRHSFSMYWHTCFLGNGWSSRLAYSVSISAPPSWAHSHKLYHRNSTVCGSL